MHLAGSCHLARQHVNGDECCFDKTSFKVPHYKDMEQSCGEGTRLCDVDSPLSATATMTVCMSGSTN